MEQVRLSTFKLKVELCQKGTLIDQYLLCAAGHIDDIYPYFMRHAKEIFPMLDCMDDLRKISDLRLPANWYV